LRNSAAIALEHANKLKAIGRGVGVLGVAITTISSAWDGSLSSGEIAKIGIGILTVAGPVGWGYGILDLGTQVFTGTSITDRVGMYVDNHW
jgi:hypothetical protein